MISIFLLSLLVVLHEAGHFVVARLFGVRVLRFSVGFGPRLFSWSRGHTEYAVSAIPLGGYVKLAGEQRSESQSQPWEYVAKPIGVRALIVAAGPFVNYLIALLSLWVVFIIGYPELLPVVGKVMDKMPAQEAGLQAGDRILSIDQEPLKTWDALTKVIYVSAGHPLVFNVRRADGSSANLKITPRAKAITDPFGRKKEIGLIGISPSGDFESYRVGPVEAVGKVWQQQAEWVEQTFLSFWSMLMGRLSMRDSMTGPVGIVYLTSEAVKMGVAPSLFLISLLSLSLSIFNALPVPILDGGHLLFLAIERLRGKPVSIEIQERSAQVSFVALIALVLVICVNDFSRFGIMDKVIGWVRR